MNSIGEKAGKGGKGGKKGAKIHYVWCWRLILAANDGGKPCEMTLGASCNAISAVCEYEISNGFEHIRAQSLSVVFIPPWFQMQFAKYNVSLCSSSSGWKGCGGGLYHFSIFFFLAAVAMWKIKKMKITSPSDKLVYYEQDIVSIIRADVGREDKFHHNGQSVHRSWWLSVCQSWSCLKTLD